MAFVTMSLVRQALGRGILLGLTLVVVALVVFVAALAIIGAPVRLPSEIALVLGTIFLAGFVAAPLSIIERRAAAFPPSLGRDAFAAFASGAVAMLAFAVLYFEVVYFTWILRNGTTLQDAADALEQVWKEAAYQLGHLDRDLPVLLFVAAPAAFAPLGRLRRWRLGWQLLFVMAATLASNLVVVSLAIAGSTFDGLQVALMGALVAGFLPVLFRWADALDAWRARSLDEDVPAAT
jgi:hypothetical protein